MYKYKIQSRFHSDKHTSEWLTISHCKTRKGAEEKLKWENDHKGKYSEYRMVKIYG